MAACLDEEQPTAPALDPEASVLGISMDSLAGDPAFLAIAKALPSFGGFWYDDDGGMVVALTSPDDLDAAIELIRPFLGRRDPAGFEAEEVERSFLELAAFRTVLRAEIFEVPEVVSLAVDESDNRVHVGIESSAAEIAVRSRVSSLGIPSRAIAIRQRERVSLDSHELSDAHSTVQGGWRIENEDGENGRCTLGFPAVDESGAETFVTASHCTNSWYGTDALSDSIYQPTKNSGLAIGAEKTDPGAHGCSDGVCRHSDAALIAAVRPLHLGSIARPTERVAGRDGALTVNHSSPMIKITHRDNNVVKNETLDKVGQRTGWTYGSVKETCEDFSVTSPVSITLLCTDRVSYHSKAGDSGAPVFEYSSGTAELRGIHVGRDGTNAVMSDLAQIQLDLGDLIVRLVQATIEGPTDVPPNAFCEWTGHVVPSGLTYDYEWRRDGVLVSTSQVYSTSDTGTSHFELKFKATAQETGSESTATETIVIDQGQSGKLTC